MVERPAGEPIYLEGDDANTLFIHGSGRVYVFARDDSGCDRIVHTLERGANLGAISFLREVPRYATMRAATDVCLCTLNGVPCPSGLAPPVEGTEAGPSEASPPFGPETFRVPRCQPRPTSPLPASES